MRSDKPRCPLCNRKMDLGESGTLPEHENYNKTARCPGSGRSFVNRGDRLDVAAQDVLMRSLPLRLEAAALGMMLSYLGNR